MKNQADTLLGGRTRIFQNERGAKASSDSVLLSAAIGARDIAKGADALDAGVGNGAAAMCLLSRLPAARITGIDIDAEALALARLSAAENGFSDRFEALNEDVLRQSADFKKRLFDIVVTNPPYFSGKAPDDAARARARISDFDLHAWIKGCADRLKASGLFAMIHDAGRTGDITAALFKCKFGRIEIFPIASRAGGDAKRVAVRAIKGSRSPSALRPPIAMHEANGAWSEAARAILEDGRTLEEALSAQRF
ncbi:MAG: methyltransferase [Rickettsiales bacterium]|nr:methyltransferase [Rickettsiales bacterium]